MKIGFTGSRTIQKFNQEMLDTLKKEIKIGDMVIHGNALGADKLVESFCQKNGIPSIKIRPINPGDRLHYLFRNVEIVTMSNKLIAFWDGKSTGTKFTIDYAKSRYKEVVVIRLNEFL